MQGLALNPIVLFTKQMPKMAAFYREVIALPLRTDESGFRNSMAAATPLRCTTERRERVPGRRNSSSDPTMSRRRARC